MRAVGAVLVAAAFATGLAFAEPLPREEVPEPLQPWIDWVLRGHGDAGCGVFHADAEHRLCAWPSRLVLALDDGGGTFEQLWEVQRDAWVDLPGDGRRWPREVEVEGAPAVVVEQGGVPRLRLTAGRHRVSGRFLWDRLPEFLPIPAATGLLDLRVRGQSVPFPGRGDDGRLWLQEREEEAAGEESRIDVTVHRLVRDDIPLVLVTRVEIDVSGQGREVLLGPVLPSGFTPMALDSPLPARLEADGRVRFQARPGRWRIEMRARHAGPAAALSPAVVDQPWDASEVWVFEAQPDLRLVTVEGVAAVDPQQTDLPTEWRHLPAYLVGPGDTLRLVERRRGDSDPAPDQLSLSRTIWLDFDGGGYSFHDEITGTLGRSWRLEMAPPSVLGRAAVGGRDQLITRLTDAAAPGIEIRAGALLLDADSRLNEASRVLPAVSWLHDFVSVGGHLHLPPGWRLLHTRGVDRAQPTWAGTWTLLDLFVVLITALATARLFGWRWGAIALAAVGLTYTEPGAPQWVWLAALATEALARLVPSGRFLLVVRAARVAALAAVVVAVLPFVVGQVRRGIYPALEHPLPSEARLAGTVQVDDAVVPPEVARMRKLADAGAVIEFSRPIDKEPDPLEIDARAMVQTGPGLPTWRWRTVSLTWTGPVERDQRITLWLLPPWATLALAVVQVLLLAALVVRLVRAPRATGAPATAGAVALAVLVAAGAAAPPATAAEFPPQALLEELRLRLLQPPECRPTCASVPRMHLDVTPERARARLHVDIAAPSAIPLPGQAGQWLPREVVVDGQVEAALSQDANGTLWLYLDSGRHEVLIEGPLPARDTVQIPLPIQPRWLEAEVNGWTLDGLHENGVADASLQLTRLAPADGEAVAPLQADQLPGFARVERTLLLGISWRAQTRVVRVTPADAAMVLEVPLLPGEAVTTADLRVVDGKVQVHLPARANEVLWQSTLEPTTSLKLTAPDDVSWVEVWQVAAGSLWHVEASGIPPVHGPSTNGPPSRWQPWPGESLRLAISRPAGVEGQSLTVDRSETRVSPGLRATDVTLLLALRSSRGGQHEVTLPAGAELIAVEIDGREQPIGQEGGRVLLPISPGAQRVELSWRESGGVRAFFRTPPIEVGLASVNAHVAVTMPGRRWILFTGGPRLGPAVLFWSLMPVLLLVAIGLGRIRTTPLGAVQWFLLGLGLTQIGIVYGLVIVGWLLALGWRRTHGDDLDGRGFDLVQVLLVFWTVLALGVLFAAIQLGLLGEPDMQIAGNGSHAGSLNWYEDRAAAVLPQAWVLSVPLFVYRLLMLAWALWIAQALLVWLRWGWESFGMGGYWRPLRPSRGAE